MNKLLMVIAAGAALGTAAMASAQYSGQYRYPGQYGGGYSENGDWNQNRSYADFDREYRHTIDGIRHGLSDGTFSPSRANDFYRELQSIRRAAYSSQQYGNYRNDTFRRGWRDCMSGCTTGMTVRTSSTTVTADTVAPAGMIPGMAITSRAIRQMTTAITTINTMTMTTRFVASILD